MPSTARILRDAIGLISEYGLHTGEQFAARGTDALDICAAIYVSATETLPGEFYTDELAALRLIEASAPAMDAIRAVSATLDFPPPHIDEVPQHIEHVSNWANTPGIGQQTPPTKNEVIGRLVRTADALERRLARFPHQRAA